jgi:hypothetical protein
MGFQNIGEAKKFLEDLKQRLAKFELALHLEKTRLSEFGRFAAGNRRKSGKGKLATFDFLEFTHICSVTRVTKKFKLLRQTISKRLKAKLVELKVKKLRKRMHDKIDVAGKWLKSVVKGYCNYFAVPNNTRVLSSFRHSLCKIWIKILRHRGRLGESLGTSSTRKPVTESQPNPIAPLPVGPLWELIFIGGTVRGSFASTDLCWRAFAKASPTAIVRYLRNTNVRFFTSVNSHFSIHGWIHKKKAGAILLKQNKRKGVGKKLICHMRWPNAYCEEGAVHDTHQAQQSR